MFEFALCLFDVAADDELATQRKIRSNSIAGRFICKRIKLTQSQDFFQPFLFGVDFIYFSDSIARGERHAQRCQSVILSNLITSSVVFIAIQKDNCATQIEYQINKRCF